MVALKGAIVRGQPKLPGDLMALIRQSRQIGLSPGDFEAHPVGLDAVRPHLEFAIDMVHRQGLLSRRPKLEELFHPATGLD